MKKLIVAGLLCVIFFLTTFSVGQTFAFSDEIFEFHYGNKVFTYSLASNIKTSNIFAADYEINKYNRFGSKEERVGLLKHITKVGIDKEMALEYLFPNLLKTIEKIKNYIYIKPKDACLSIKPETEKVFFIEPEVVGFELDKTHLINNIFNAYIENSPLTFNVPYIKNHPQITKQKLKTFTNLRADFSTNIETSSADRKHNIKNALSSINITEIMPGEIFSFNRSVGKRTAENGYRSAKIIVNNEFVDGVGGGVCQVSSTLYNAALLAGLEIVEANKHSKQVAYVKPGFDAMVNFGSSDLKFKNNTCEKITIITNYSSSRARIRLFGENLNQTKYVLKNDIFNIEEPIEEVLIDEKQAHLEHVKYDDEFFYLKKASKGMEIKSYREKYVNNVLVEKHLLRHDKFKVQNAVKIYGSLKRENNTNENYSF